MKASGHPATLEMRSFEPHATTTRTPLVGIRIVVGDEYSHRRVTAYFMPTPDYNLTPIWARWQWLFDVMREAVDDAREYL